MKTFLLFSLSLIFLTIFAYKAESTDLGLGIGVSYKAGISAVDTPSGRKNGVAPSALPDVAISFHLPINEKSNIGLSTDLAFTNYSYLMINYQTNDKATVNHSFITLNPNINFGGFTIGLQVGIPLSSDILGKRKIGTSAGAIYIDEEIDVKTSTQNIDASVTIGGTIPIFRDKTGTLNLIIKGSYNFLGVYKNFKEDDPLKDNSVCPVCDNSLSNENNPRPATLGLGFSYLFNLK